VKRALVPAAPFDPSGMSEAKRVQPLPAWPDDDALLAALVLPPPPAASPPPGKENAAPCGVRAPPSWLGPGADAAGPADDAWAMVDDAALLALVDPVPEWVAPAPAADDPWAAECDLDAALTAAADAGELGLALTPTCAVPPSVPLSADGTPADPSPGDEAEAADLSDEQRRVVDLVLAGESIFFTGCAGASPFHFPRRCPV
jgi:hypothetical protein